MEKKLIVIDMDGTLLIDANRIGDFSVSTLRSLSKAGHYVVLASGRPYRAMKRYYDLLGLTGPIICYNGALVFNPHSSEPPMVDRKFDQAVLKDIAIKAPYVTSFMAEDLEDVYVSRIDRYLSQFFHYEGMGVHVGPINQILNKDTYTALFRCVHKHDQELAELAREYPGIELRHWTNSLYSELAFIGTDKGSAVKRIQELTGISKENTIAFGDADNDMTMLMQAGLPFAMKGCKSTALTSAFPSTKKSNAEDGVARMLVELLPDVADVDNIVE